MSVQNLVGISLERITPAKETIKRLLDGAARHITDATKRQFRHCPRRWESTHRLSSASISCASSGT